MWFMLITDSDSENAICFNVCHPINVEYSTNGVIDTLGTFCGLSLHLRDQMEHFKGSQKNIVFLKLQCADIGLLCYMDRFYDEQDCVKKMHPASIVCVYLVLRGGERSSGGVATCVCGPIYSNNGHMIRVTDLSMSSCSPCQQYVIIRHCHIVASLDVFVFLLKICAPV